MFPFLGAAGASHRRQVRDSFVRAVDEGLDLAPALVLITGNLFGTSTPSRELAEFARAQIGRFAAKRTPVLLAAGPLDALSDDTYAAGAFADLARVSVFPTAPKPIDVADAGVTVIGASWSTAPVGSEVLANIARHRTQRYLVGAASLELPETEDGIAALRRQIAASGAHYLALGGSPAPADLSTEDVIARYPGAPELVAPAAVGSPLVVHLDRPPVVTPRPVAQRRYERFTVTPADYASHEDLAAAIRALGDPDLVATVHLKGEARANEFIDVAGLQQRLALEFLTLDVVDESMPAADGLGGLSYPAFSVAGKFVAVAQRELERTTSDEDRWRAGAALRLGLALLEGRQPS